MSSFKNVMVIGAGGNLGPAILYALLHHSSFNTTVLSREGSSSTFPPGVKVLRADYNSMDSLKTAFMGQDVVVSLVAGAVLGNQNNLIDAAIAAGVKRFLPSEFGSNTTDARTRAIVPMYKSKVETVDYLKSKESEISWTSIVTGPFFDWGLKVGFLGFDAAHKVATLYEDGTAKFSSTNLHTIGLAVVKALENAEGTKNQYVFVSGFQTSQKEILEVAEKVTGSKWIVRNASVDDAIKKGNEKILRGDYSGIEDLILGATFGPKQLGDLSLAGLWNEKLDLVETDIETSVSAAFAGRLVYEASISE
ncbi:hypothetical protein GT037_007267 [Alternaria burnsii]|uniref:NmrA-like domain-containing protein n=1 Tax=Alternaria burnsii TaxID=1187904 RepID=A0A8H7B3V2_9PLEO|nr:uncharacterized protein GT037_007267 [Alternaria burnsii]KAF7674507.1 hypothetical protein GT037_007267 [Alternaria burnsii]CAI9629927.1 unnamed protein product [Alternaria burnsii]